MGKLNRRTIEKELLSDELTFQKNKIYNCDNLALMNIIPDDSIDLIYCDILYGTNRKNKDYCDLKSEQRIIEEHYAPPNKRNASYLKRYG